MEFSAEIAALLGDWQGVNHLWLAPNTPPDLSETVAHTTTVMHDGLLELSYSWAFQDQPQEGRLVLSEDDDHTHVKAVWMDSWHMANSFMVLEGAITEKGVIALNGSYAAPPGPDWGWKIQLEPLNANSFKLLMFNVTPKGKEALAVEVTYVHPNGEKASS